MTTHTPQPDISGEEFYRALSVGTLIDLAQPLEDGMPCSPSHPGFKMALVHRHGDRAAGQRPAEPREVTGANEIIVTGGHVGTHVDALCHVALSGRLFGGHDAVLASSTGRFSVHGIETVTPFICRGVLADIPRLLGVSMLSPEYGITSEHLKDALSDTSVGRGEVVLVRTGWPQLYGDATAYIGHHTGVPGLTADAANFLADLELRAVGSDTVATDQIFAGHGHSELPAHRILLVERGIHIIEVMNLEHLAAAGAREFLFVAVPLKITGATGSPVRPIAVLPAISTTAKTH